MWVIDDFDVPGKTGPSLGLLRRGVFPGLPTRTLAVAQLVLVTIGVIGIVKSGTPDSWVILSFGALCLVPCTALLMDSALWSHTRRFVWDASQGTLRIELAAWAPWAFRVVEIPFSTVQEIRFEFGAERDGTLPIRMVILTNDPRWPGGVERLKVVEVRRRVDALDLAFRIGRAMGWEGYVVRWPVNGDLEVDLVRDVQSEVHARPLPAEGVPLDFASATASETR